MAEDNNGHLWLNTANNGIIGLDINVSGDPHSDKQVSLRASEVSILAWSGAHLIMVDRDGVEAFIPAVTVSPILKKALESRIWY